MQIFFTFTLRTDQIRETQDQFGLGLTSKLQLHIYLLYITTWTH